MVRHRRGAGLTERTLDHLSGYRGSKPVRVGNGAFDQQQLGRVGDAPSTPSTPSCGGPARRLPPRSWEGVASLVDDAIGHRHDADQGIWEVRGEPQEFTASKVMCWVAVDRGVSLATERGDMEWATRWRGVADDIKAEVLDKGVSARGVFRQHYQTEELDAALLLIPIMGFLPPDDERVRQTVLAIADELTEDWSGPTLQGRLRPTPASPAGRGPSPSARSGW